MNFEVNREVIKSDLDVFASAGFKTAHVENVTLTLERRMIRIIGKVETTMVSLIEISEASILTHQ
jgi:hypothetical protein